MGYRRWLCAAAALLLACGAVAEGGESTLSADTVYHLELRLAELGYFSGESDGIFDADTRTALEAFQQANGLTVSGALDVETLDALNGEAIVSRQVYLKGFVQDFVQQDALQAGSSGKDVQAVQNRLRELGFTNGRSDGVFGEDTEQAVRKFQLANGLEETGVVDASTRMRLSANSAITWEGFLMEMSSEPGESGLNVSALQRRLAALGYFTGEATGSYGELTQQAVTRFQQENGLAETGAADADTWSVLCGGEAVALRPMDALQRGDAGERVRAAQDRLIALGYLSGEAGGSFDYATETAVRLFQMASGAENTGILDAEGEQALLAEDAPAAQSEAAQQAFSERLDAANGETQAALAAAAEGLLGAGFGDAADGLYPGFAFVQYACAQAGLPVLQPETLVSMAGTPVTAASAVQAGDILALQGEDSGGVSMLLGIGAGDGKLYYATDAGGWIVLGFVSQIHSTSAYRWSAGEGAQ